MRAAGRTRRHSHDSDFTTKREARIAEPRVMSEPNAHRAFGGHIRSVTVTLTGTRSAASNCRWLLAGSLSVLPRCAPRRATRVCATPEELQRTVMMERGRSSPASRRATWWSINPNVNGPRRRRDDSVAKTYSSNVCVTISSC